MLPFLRGPSHRRFACVTGDVSVSPYPSTSFPPVKSWHRRALEQPQALLRIAGQRYPGMLERVEDPTLRAALGAVATAKYPRPPGTSSLEQVWFFHFHPARQAP